MIFDGKAYAKDLEQKLTQQVASLVKKPKIVSVIVGDDPASILYTKLKKSAAERVGIEFEVVRLDSLIETKAITQAIEKFGADETVTGVMVQLPLPNDSKGETLKVLKSIPLTKDVDGLRWEESGIQPATVKAVISILNKIGEQGNPDLFERKFVVIGARGAVGRPLTHFLRSMDIGVSEVEWDTPNPSEIVQWAEVVISCVGKAGIVTDEMVPDGAVVIDVGMSEVEGKVVGDMTQEVYQRASLAVPVPGGVGPVTIACLLENTLELVDKNRR